MGIISSILEQLFGTSSSDSQKAATTTDSLPPLSDADYEFLWSQLLEGVANGWYPQRILQFFNKLGDRGKIALWLEWLQRFGTKVLASSAPNRLLALRMIRLGELTQELPSLHSISEISYEIGRQLLAKEQMHSQPPQPSPPPVAPPPSSEATPTQEATPIEEGVEMLTLDQLVARLQEDQALLEQIAGQLGLENADPQTLIQRLTEQLTNLSENPPEESQDINYWFDRGLGQVKLGALEDALFCWDKVIELEPNFFQAWHNRGSSLAELGRFEEAIASFDQALTLNPDDPQLWHDRGKAYYQLERWSEALENWQKAMELNYNNHQIWYHQGCALEKLERYQEALDCYQKALEIEPTFEPAQTSRNAILEKFTPES
jgi:tetratricopeptide (TPR) repeat protein